MPKTQTRTVKGKGFFYKNVWISQCADVPTATINKGFHPIGFLTKLITLALFLFLTFAANSLYAQVSLDQRKMAAVMVIIKTLLLEEETNISLALNGYQSTPRSISNLLNIDLDTQSQDVEFCFVVSANIPLPNEAITLTINGAQQLGDSSLVTGENCYSIPLASQQQDNTAVFNVQSGALLNISHMGIDPSSQSFLGLTSLTRSSWDERAVRKVLKVFAFGGHARSEQIALWANMRPRDAIEQMLNFDQHNARLSPLTVGERYAEPATSHGTITEFYDHIGSQTADTPIPLPEREYLGTDGYRFPSTFGRMVVMRGLNPFRQRIGFFETNYHMATNRSANVERRQMLRYYDDIMAAHEQRVPYHEVIGVAAKSAAVAMQYGHRRNICRNYYINSEGECRLGWQADPNSCEFEGNADFAREIHQLFYGIFGTNDPTHEDVTIENTARMLTGMDVEFIEDFGFSTEVDFNTCQHHRDSFGPLRILGQDISGMDAAEKIDRLMPISIQHEESLFNLPVYIISTLADNNLTEIKRSQLRAAWAALGANKDFLTFIHAYAISDLLHDLDHVKFFSSFERAYYQANKFNIDNIEAYLSNDGRAGRGFDAVIEGDNAGEVFRPLHNVFGGQTSLEASDSSLVFERNYNRNATRESWQFRAELPSYCRDCDQGLPWFKEWSKVIPQQNGGYSAGYVAEWLWMHVVGNLDNFTELERSQLVAILGAVRLPPVGGEEPSWRLDDEYTYFDLNGLLCIREDRIDQGFANNSLADLMSYEGWDEYCRHNNGAYSQIEVDAFNFTFTGQQLRDSDEDPFPYFRSLIDELAAAEVGLDQTDDIRRRRANERVQAALAFIFATPFVFAEGQ